jgi:hypothetical protein
MDSSVWMISTKSLSMIRQFEEGEIEEISISQGEEGSRFNF